MNLREIYEKAARPEMMKRFGWSSPLAVPRILKVVVNTGTGRVREDKEREVIEKHLALITGQKPSPRPAKKSIAAFKTRQGMIIGLVTTLRGKRMYDFLSRLVEVALPRTRDFRGIPESSVDSSGNLTLGVREHMVFPEIVGEDIRTIFGLEVTVVTNAKKREEAVELFKLLGFPLKA